MPDFSIEQKIKGRVIGLDEVGRGPLAGPVVSCGCVFNKMDEKDEFSKFILDSKKLSSKNRQFSFKYLQSLKKENIIDYNLGIATVNEIDSLNILEATKLSMRRAVDKFSFNRATLLIDGNFILIHNKYIEKPVIKGDQVSLSIAAASIIAKVHRDRLMRILGAKFKNFGWDKNAGYGTKKHIDEIRKIGPTIHHRKTFEPIKSLIHS